MFRITKNELDRFAYTNEELLKSEPRGIVYEFHGLNDGLSMDIPHTKFSYMLAENSLIYVRPFYGPWSWMNRASVKMLDDITDALFEKYSKQMPIASTGLSMGGLAALVYTRYAKYTPVLCGAICPVCDILYHYKERKDTARTLHCAFGGYDIPLKDALKESSPLHIAAQMPDIKYIILATLEDSDVDYKKHSEPFVQKLAVLGRKVEYITIPGRSHCDLTKESSAFYKNYIIANM